MQMPTTLMIWLPKLLGRTSGTVTVTETTRLQNKNMKKSRTTIFGFDNCGKDGTGCPNSWERQVELVTVISRTLSQ